jgi:hypothetical protein
MLNLLPRWLADSEHSNISHPGARSWSQRGGRRPCAIADHSTHSVDRPDVHREGVVPTSRSRTVRFSTTDRSRRHKGLCRAVHSNNWLLDRRQHIYFSCHVGLWMVDYIYMSSCFPQTQRLCGCRLQAAGSKYIVRF